MSDNPGGAVNLGSAYGEILIDYSKVSGEMNRTFTNLEQGLGGKLQALGDKIQRWGTQFTLATAPITAFTVKGIKSFADFEEILAEIAARTGATAEEMELVKETAIKMGAATRFSATDASEAMLQLLSSGSSLKETMIALPHVMNLAAAGTIDLGRAADATTDILAQFQLDVSKSKDVVDILAKASGASSATIAELIDGFANVGPVAADFGISMEDTAAILATFAEYGIKGAEAGTQLRSMLTNFNRPTEDAQEAWRELGVSLFDAKGNFRDINDVLLDLDKALAKMPEGRRSQYIQRLAGSFGQMGLSALLSADGIGAMNKAMDEATGAAELAAAKSNTLKGMWESLSGSVETLMFTALEPLVNNHIKPLIAQGTLLVNKLSEWMTLNPELTSQIGMLLGMLVILGPTFAVIGTAIGLLFNPIALLITASAALYMALKNDWFGINAIVGTITKRVSKNLNQLRVIFRDQVNMIKMHWGELTTAIQSADPSRIILAFEGLFNGLNFYAENAGYANERLSTFLQILYAVGEEIVGVVVPVIFFLSDAFNTLVDAGQDVINMMGDWVVKHPETATAIAKFAALFMLVVAAVQTTGGALGLLAAVAVPAITAIGAAIAFLLSPIGLLIAAGVALYLAYTNNWLGIRDVIDSAVAFILPILGALQTWFTVEGLPVIKQAIDDFTLIWNAFSAILGLSWDSIIEPGLSKMFDWFVVSEFQQTEESINAFLVVWGLFTGLLAGAWGLIEPQLSKMFGWFTSTGLPVAKMVLEETIEQINLFIERANRIWDAISGSVGAFKTNFTQAFTDVLKAVTEVYDKVQALISLAGNVGNVATGGMVGGIIGGITNIARGVLPFAEGGQYPADKPRMVGEGGVELEVPRSSGMIVNNDQFATAIKALGSMFAPLPMGAGSLATAGGGGNGGIQIGSIEIIVPEWKTDDPYRAGEQMGEGFEAKLNRILKERG